MGVFYLSISQRNDGNDRVLPQELWEAGSLLRVVGGELSLLSQTVKSDRFENRIHLSELRNVKTNIADEHYTSVWGEEEGKSGKSAVERLTGLDHIRCSSPSIHCICGSAD